MFSNIFVMLTLKRDYFLDRTELAKKTLTVF